MSVLSIRDLTVGIGTVDVCRRLSLEFAPRQCWAILGRNGSGKTTLLHTLAGLRPATNGSVRIDDRPLNEQPRRFIAQRLGLLPQDNHDPFPATVLETAVLGRHPHCSPWSWETADDVRIARQALEHVGLKGWDDRAVATLSGGERRRLALATLLTQATDILLLDEPTNHLDLHHQVALLNLLVRQASEHAKTVIMVLHDVNLAARYADHCILLHGNGDTSAGPCETVLRTAALEQLYRLELRQVGDRPPAWLPT